MARGGGRGGGGRGGVGRGIGGRGIGGRGFAGRGFGGRGFVGRGFRGGFYGGYRGFYGYRRFYGYGYYPRYWQLWLLPAATTAIRYYGSTLLPGLLRLSGVVCYYPCSGSR